MDMLNFSYFFGLIQTDGSFSETTRNRGRVQIELQQKDGVVLQDISKLLTVNYLIKERTRNTNYKSGYTSTILRIYSQDFREKVKSWGLFPGKKSNIIQPPLNVEYDLQSYLRGMYDGDGSLGFTSQGFPFMSFVTDSQYIAEFIVDHIHGVTKKPKKKLNRNTRDNVYNICIYKEDAMKFAKWVYLDSNGISINRKKETAKEIQKWKRPEFLDGKKSGHKSFWTKEEEKFVLTHSIEEGMKFTGRTKRSVSDRKKMLQKRVC